MCSLNPDETEQLINILKQSYKIVKAGTKRPHDAEPREAAAQPKPERDWVCSGRLWAEEGKRQCKGGDRSDIKERILYGGTYHIVCKECKLHRDRVKRAEKKRAKLEKETEKNE